MRWRAFHLDPIGLGHFVLRIGNARLQTAVVGQQKQALAVAIQPPCWIDVRDRDEVLERAAALAVAELRQDVERLVKDKQPGLRRRPTSRSS